MCHVLWFITYRRFEDKAKDRRQAFDDVLADLKEAVLASNITPDDVAADLNRRLEFEDEAPDLTESVIASNTFPDDVAADLNRRLELEDEAPDINEAVIARVVDFIGFLDLNLANHPTSIKKWKKV